MEGSYHSCYGVHRLKWQVDDDQVTVSVQIPANTTAEIRLSDVKELVQTDELQFRKEGTYMTASTGSGIIAFNISCKYRKSISDRKNSA